jgi:tetratricopeptide (TPR) repeat protein
MKTKKRAIAALAIVLVFFASCKAGTDERAIKRMQEAEEGVSKPSSIAEITDAIQKYEQRAADVQLAYAQVGTWYKLLGTRYLENKMYGEALKSFEKALEYYPLNQNLYYYVGVSAGYVAKAQLDYAATGADTQRYHYLQLAESAYLQALDIAPNYNRALYAIGVLYVYDLADSEKAIPYLEKFVSREKKDTNGMMALAAAYYATGDYNNAVAMYDNVISSNTNAERKAAAAANKQEILSKYGAR